MKIRGRPKSNLDLNLNFEKVSVGEMYQNWIGLNFSKRILLPLRRSWNASSDC